jgi:hypothetical protein
VRSVKETLLDMLSDLFNPALSWPSDAQEATIRIFLGIVPNEGQSDAEFFLHLNNGKNELERNDFIFICYFPQF